MTAKSATMRICRPGGRRLRPPRADQQGRLEGHQTQQRQDNAKSSRNRIETVSSVGLIGVRPAKIRKDKMAQKIAKATMKGPTRGSSRRSRRRGLFLSAEFFRPSTRKKSGDTRPVKPALNGSGETALQ